MRKIKGEGVTFSAICGRLWDVLTQVVLFIFTEVHKEQIVLFHEGKIKVDNEDLKF